MLRNINYYHARIIQALFFYWFFAVIFLDLLVTVFSKHFLNHSLIKGVNYEVIL